MFNFLKDKISGFVKKFSKEVEEEAEEVPTEEIVEKKKAVKEIIKVEKKAKKEVKKAKSKEIKEEPSPEPEEPPVEGKPKKKWFGARIVESLSKVNLSEAKFDELFWEIELELLQNNMASQVVEKIKADLKKSLVDQPLARGNLQDQISEALKKSFEEILGFKVPNLLEKIKEKKPYVIAFVGINGSGKTTTIAKVANMILKAKKSVVLVAADTFRAAAIQQLEEHANKLKVKMIKHDYGSDPAAVSFDGIKYAEAHDIDIVLIDTAGRLHTNTNLMDELKKIKRVANPDLILYIGESITGNDCIEQATKYNEAIGIDGIILSKVDVDEKGGTAISIAYVTEKPIWLLCTGQEYEDIEVFNKKKIIENLF